jgi:LPS export ABC transporter permease LptG/LPS export ABC transporter permease LptF
MLRIIDRYVVREILPPFALALLVFTFILMMDPVARLAQPLLAKGAPATVIAKALLTLVPQALAVTIPMAFLLGLLVAFGRLSGDSEWVAIQACGVSLTRMLRPVLTLALFAWAATQWVLIDAVPWGNQAFREIEYNLVAQKAESEIKPRVFFEEFPNLVLYVRDVPQEGGGWNDVFVADTSHVGQPVVYTARHGRMLLDRSRKTVEMVLDDGVRHRVTVDNSGKEKYETNRFGRVIQQLDPTTVFKDAGPAKGEPEMTIAELRVRAEELRKQGMSPHNAIWYIQQKFSIPVACLVFALIGLGFGVSSSRGGKLAAFTVGIGVIFAYYVLLFVSHALVKGAVVPPPLGPWVPNIVLGLFGGIVVIGRSRLGGRSFQLAIPAAWLARFRPNAAAGSPAPGPSPRTTAGRVVLVLRLPRFYFWLPQPLILDRYVTKSYLRILGLTFASLLGIFYISSFIDLSDKLFKGKTTLTELAQFFWFSTPQFVYYVVPISVLLATLVTIGLLTRSSELIVMRACGISLYRVAMPLLAAAVVASGFLFLLEEQVLASANRQAEQLNQHIRTGTARTFDLLNRRWVVGRNGAIYHYEYFEPRRKELTQFSVYEFDQKTWSVVRRLYLESASFDKSSLGKGRSGADWISRLGWMREIDRAGAVRSYVAFNGRHLTLEPPDYFGTERPEADRMTFNGLRLYIAEMRAAGFNVVPFLVDLHQKISFPFVTIIMTLLGVPFAVTTGRRGALYGIGVGIVLAMVYWTANNLFGAVGDAGLLPPLLAAWAPNVLFGAGAAYLLLTVRT